MTCVVTITDIAQVHGRMKVAALQGPVTSDHSNSVERLILLHARSQAVATELGHSGHNVGAGGQGIGPPLSVLGDNPPLLSLMRW